MRSDQCGQIGRSHLLPIHYQRHRGQGRVIAAKSKVADRQIPTPIGRPAGKYRQRDERLKSAGIGLGATADGSDPAVAERGVAHISPEGIASQKKVHHVAARVGEGSGETGIRGRFNGQGHTHVADFGSLVTVVFFPEVSATMDETHSLHSRLDWR